MTPRTGQLELTLGTDAALERAAEWAGKARRCIERVWPGQQFTAEHVRDSVGDPPGSGNSMGPVFRAAARDGLITCTGFTTSTRPDAHGRALRTWRRL